jgi:hypothetical protein
MQGRIFSRCECFRKITPFDSPAGGEHRINSFFNLRLGDIQNNFFELLFLTTKKHIMEEKHNHATPQRPTGTRPLDAAVIPVNIPAYILQLKQEEAYAKNGKNAITVFKSESVTITVIVLKAGEFIRPGSEENEAIMSLQLVNGELIFESFGREITLIDGELITLHEILSFKARAIQDSVCLLTMVK